MVDDLQPRDPFTSSSGDAPVIFFDEAPASASFNGVVALSITTRLYTPTADGKPNVEQHVVAHLRTNIQGAIALRAAIDAALLLAQPVEGQKN